VSICYVILVLVSSCSLLWLLSLNWFSTLIAVMKKGNTVPMQTGLKFFGWAKTNYIIANHVYTRHNLLFRSFPILVDLVVLIFRERNDDDDDVRLVKNEFILYKRSSRLSRFVQYANGSKNVPELNMQRGCSIPNEDMKN